MAAQRVIKPSFPTFNRVCLPNGVRVVSECIPSVRSVSVGVWVDTGSRDERPEESGISHFIEHMVFKGTRKRRMYHIAQRLEAVGGYLNAFTSKEHTCYYARGLDEHLGRAVDVTTDLVLNPVFPEKEVEKEKDVVIEELKMYEDTPDDLVFDRFEAALYAGDALARPIIGTPESVRSFTRDQLLAYMDAHYTPDRIVVALAGNLDHGRAVRLVERAFAGSPRAPRPRARSPVAAYQPRAHAEQRPIQQAHLVLGTRCAGIRDTNRSVLSLLNTVLGGGMSSRLNQNIREKFGFCYSIYSFVNMLQDTGDFGVYMGTDAGKVDKARKLIVRELEKLVREEIRPQKLDQAKNQLKGSLLLGLESMSNRMMRLGRMELYFGRYFTLDEVVNEIDRVTTPEIQEAAMALFDPGQFTSVVLLPQD